jgi:hypothetical protein
VPCFFCLAVFMMLAGAVTTSVIEALRANVATVATTPPAITADSATMARIELTVAGPRNLQVPVNMTVYKKQQRIRIQVMTHDVSRDEARAVQELVARAAGLQIIGGSDPASEALVHETLAAHAAEHAAQAAGAESTQSMPARQRRSR